MATFAEETTEGIEANIMKSALAASLEISEWKRFYQVEWIMAEICNVIAILSVIWSASSLVVHGIRTGIWKRENRLDIHKYNAGAVYTCAVIATFCSLLRLIPSQVIFHLGSNNGSPVSCDITINVALQGYSVTVGCTYIFLWFRQRSLYQHPAMKPLQSKWLSCFSWGSITIIVMGYLVLAIGLAVSDKVVDSIYGCILKPSEEFTMWPLFLINGIEFTGQASMLFLFFYPLRAKVTTNTAKRMKLIMKRSGFFAGACVGSEVIALVVLYFAVSENSSIYIPLTVYDLNMLTNVWSVVLSFESWKDILFSPCFYSTPEKITESSHSTTGV